MMRLYAGTIDQLGEREIGVIAATRALGRDGHIVEPSGIDLRNFRKNPIALWSHNPEWPIGTVPSIGIRDDALMARIEFAPAGASPLADQICSLAKAGVVNAVSIGFDPDPEAAVPLDERRPRGGQCFLRSELLELSLVSVPADTGALVFARSAVPRTMFRSLTPVPAAAMQRAITQAQRAKAPAVFSPTIQTWLLQEQRKHERRNDYEARQARLRELRARAP